MTVSRRSWIIALAWIAAGSLFVARFVPNDPPHRLPELSLSTLDGRQIGAGALQGHPVLVTFWSITCGPCLREIPDLIALHNEFAAQGLIILGIAMPYDPPDRVLALTRERKLPYAIVLDPLGKTAVAFGDIEATPTTFLFDAQGDGLQRIVGSMNIRQMRAELMRLLALSPTPVRNQTLGPSPASQNHALD